MMLYPVFSVVPQELVFRTFFFHRYGPLFGSARWTMVLGYALTIALKANLLVGVTLHLEPSVIVIGLFAQFVVIVIILFMGFPALMFYLRGLAKRIPSRALARQTRIVLWGFYGGLLATAAWVGVVIGTEYLMGGSDDLANILALLFIPLGAALLIFAIWWLVLPSFAWLNWLLAICHKTP